MWVGIYGQWLTLIYKVQLHSFCIIFLYRRFLRSLLISLIFKSVWNKVCLKYPVNVNSVLSLFLFKHSLLRKKRTVTYFFRTLYLIGYYIPLKNKWHWIICTLWLIIHDVTVPDQKIWCIVLWSIYNVWLACDCIFMSKSFLVSIMSFHRPTIKRKWELQLGSNKRLHVQMVIIYIILFY